MTFAEMKGGPVGPWPIAEEAPETRPLTLLVRVRQGGAEVADDASRPSWRAIEVFTSDGPDAGPEGAVPDVSHETGGAQGF